MKKIKFISKAYNLTELKKKKFKEFKIPNYFFFTVSDWKKNKKYIIQKIKKNLSAYICIRSSFIGEDTSINSLAGKFNSYIKIKKNEKNIVKYVNLLIQQYREFDKINIKKHQILIQNFVDDNICSGVMTNYCISDGSPYYTINYDDISKSTESVTSGNINSHRVLFIYKNNFENIRNKNFKKLIFSLQKIEKAYLNIALDIEFSINKKNQINILQIRPISKKIKWKKFHLKKFEKNLIINKNKYDKIKKQIKNQKNLVFSCMSDWNPAEMIGVHPEYLSYTLYEYFIMKKAWFNARKEMGYGMGEAKCLMQNFLGKPYINLNLSFESLVPTSINKKLRDKLVSYWLTEIQKKPYLHDKIEFDLVQNCYYFGLKKKINSYRILTKKQKIYLYNKLLNHTKFLIFNFEKQASILSSKLKSLEMLRVKTQKKKLKQKNIKENLIFLSSKLENLGIIPFAKFARYAFIGKLILISMLKNKIISIKIYNRILGQMNTISSDYVSDKKKLEFNKIGKAYFNNLYFHLRPGSYDIKSKRYLPKIQRYDMGSKINDILNINKINILKDFSSKELIRINRIINKKIPGVSLSILLSFIINSMRLRENSKFIFTRTLSDIIELIKKINFKKNIDRSKIDFSSLISILKKKKFFNHIVNNDFSSIHNRSSKLPYLIQSNNDFFVSSVLMTKPNFVTQKKIKSKVLNLDSNKNILSPNNKNIAKELSSKIILIENADPGYDWIFSYKISGLITKFGGVNSHMTIRCEEKQLPAIIGAGEDLFENIKREQIIEIDCKLQKINFLN